MIILKVGGSLFSEAPELLRHIQETGVDVLIVPGGGAFADLVRRINNEHGLSDDAAHWMAVLAMDKYAYYLWDKTGIELTATLGKIRGIRIALPYEILLKNDELPHSWDVTSDTIAAWMAEKTGGRLVKATDVDGILLDGKLLPSVDASALIGMETCLDKALPSFLVDHGMNAYVVNGRYSDRVIKAIMGEPTIGTMIIGK